MTYEKPSEAAVTAAESLERMVNSFGGRADADHVVTAMATMHRTLNQAFTGRVVIPFVRRMAKMYGDGRYDGRNELACKLCSVMWESVKAHFSAQGWDIAEDEHLGLPMI